jgi:hypothetical protein
MSKAKTPNDLRHNPSLWKEINEKISEFAPSNRVVNIIYFGQIRSKLLAIDKFSVSWI